MPTASKRPLEAEDGIQKAPAKGQRRSISVRFSAAERSLIENYAKAQRRSVSDMIRLVTLEKIEDEYDLDLFVKAKREYVENPTTIPHAKMMEKYGLDE